MTPTLIPSDLLKRSDKILFIAHLSLGDFTYLQNDFQAFAQAYPHLKIHLWVDEVRRTSDASKWESLKRYSLYDWLDSCPFFDKVYKRTYSPAALNASIEEARKENYPIVVSLAWLRPHMYAGMARQISPNGFVVGVKKRIRFAELHHLLTYRKPNAGILIHTTDASGNLQHISGVYADWFKQIAGIEIAPEQRLPFIHIPVPWKDYAEQQLTQWKIDEANRKLVFINPYAKTKKRSWPLANVAELIQAMQKQAAWHNAFFIVNAMPPELPQVQHMIAEYKLHEVVAFSATENFFQLPALLERCDLIISVETSVMHMANAVHVPVIALMRRKNPEWVPLDSNNSVVITAAKRRDWVQAIPVSAVLEQLAK